MRYRSHRTCLDSAVRVMEVIAFGKSSIITTASTEVEEIVAGSLDTKLKEDTFSYYLSNKPMLLAIIASTSCTLPEQA